MSTMNAKQELERFSTDVREALGEDYERAAVVAPHWHPRSIAAITNLVAERDTLRAKVAELAKLLAELKEGPPIFASVADRAVAHGWRVFAAGGFELWMVEQTGAMRVWYDKTASGWVGWETGQLWETATAALAAALDAAGAPGRVVETVVPAIPDWTSQMEAAGARKYGTRWTRNGVYVVWLSGPENWVARIAGCDIFHPTEKDACLAYLKVHP